MISYGLLVGTVLIILGLALRQPYLLVPGVLTVVTLLLARAWRKNALDRITYRRHLSTSRAGWGDTVELAVEVENAKPLPVPWVECLDDLPADLPVVGGHLSAHHLPGRMTLKNMLSLGWFERVTRRFSITCTQRGRYTLGPVTLVSGDPFGFDRESRGLPQTDQLIVYPRILPVAGPALLRRHPFGDQALASWIFEDPARTAGVREYQTRDPFNRIEWKATARTGRLQTRVFEASFRVQLSIFLNLSTGAYLWEGIDRRRLEFAISVAASLAHWAIGHKRSVGIYANGYHPSGGGSLSMRPGAGVHQLERILGALATLPPVPWGQLHPILNRALGSMEPGTAALIITSQVPQDLVLAAARLKSCGHPVSFVLLGNARAPRGFPSARVREEGSDVQRIVLDPAG
ncbi:MAG: DUF58 domain-containing protein [Bacillota bacterium]